MRLAKASSRFARQAEAIPMRALDMQDIGDRQIEIAMVIRAVR